MAAMEKFVILIPAGVVLEFEVWTGLRGEVDGPPAMSAEVGSAPMGRTGPPRGPFPEMGNLRADGFIERFGEIIFEENCFVFCSNRFKFK